MERCADNHEPIWHEEFHCPLCAALDDAVADADRVAHYEQLLDEIDAADMMQTLAQLDAAEQEANRAGCALTRLQHAVSLTRIKPMSRYIQNVQHVAALVTAESQRGIAAEQVDR